MKKGPYLEACGFCHIPMKVHPVRHCRYVYKAIKAKGQIVGYELSRKRRQ